MRFPESRKGHLFYFIHSSNNINRFIPGYLRMSCWTLRLSKTKRITIKNSKMICSVAGHIIRKAACCGENPTAPKLLDESEAGLHFITLQATFQNTSGCRGGPQDRLYKTKRITKQIPKIIVSVAR